MLEILGKEKKNSYTVEQLLDSKLKNVDGESNEEVKYRMYECLEEIIAKNPGKRIAIVSHGAAIKFLLQNWCKYDYNTDSFYFNEELLCKQKLMSPFVIELIIENGEIFLNVLKGAGLFDTKK